MTITVLISATIILAGYDLWVVIKKGRSETICAKLYENGKNYPVIPFALGYLMGHIWG